MAFCGKCGASMGEGKFCPKCGTRRDTEIEKSIIENPKSSNTGKKIIAAIVLIAVVIIGIFSMSSTVDEPCDWCGHRPSVAYKTSDGSKSYVCKDCSKECFFCGDKAMKHYENLLGAMVFVCNDCYKEVVGN